jgi:hypothetical protein
MGNYTFRQLLTMKRITVLGIVGLALSSVLFDADYVNANPGVTFRVSTAFNGVSRTGTARLRHPVKLPLPPTVDMSPTGRLHLILCKSTQTLLTMPLSPTLRQAKRAWFPLRVMVRKRTVTHLEEGFVASDASLANGISIFPKISPDGRYVAFQSAASNLVTGDTNGRTDIFVRDLQAGITRRASIANDGT